MQATAPPLKVLITGADGFIGKNLTVYLGEKPGYSVLKFVRGDAETKLVELLSVADAVIHLAGENRPQDEQAFRDVNVGLTASICAELEKQKRPVPLIFASSAQAELDNAYGKSKRDAEQLVSKLAAHGRNPVTIFRLPGVFGKWCKPNYNSVVATFCHNVARGQSIEIHDVSKLLRLVYIDDVLEAFASALSNQERGKVTRAEASPEYSISLGELATAIRSFPECRSSLLVERVGAGLIRALYATYVSYLPPDKFAYDVPQYADQRGVFVEMLKTHDSGQFSFFTAHPGVTRGGHYHHTKTEKFLVIKGEARFKFRNLVTNELVELHTSGDKPQVVDTIPGWSHDITNVGQDEMVVMLWANENFDRERPDTIASKV